MLLSDEESFQRIVKLFILLSRQGRAQQQREQENWKEQTLELIVLAQFLQGTWSAKSETKKFQSDGGSRILQN